MIRLMKQSGRDFERSGIRRWAASMALVSLSLIANAESNPDASIVAIIAAIEQGWEQGDGTPFRQHFLNTEGARYIESGGQNEGLDDLIDHHVEPEGDALQDFDLVFSNIESHIEAECLGALTYVCSNPAQVRHDEAMEHHAPADRARATRPVSKAWKK